MDTPAGLSSIETLRELHVLSQGAIRQTCRSPLLRPLDSDLRKQLMKKKKNETINLMSVRYGELDYKEFFQHIDSHRRRAS